MKLVVASLLASCGIAWWDEPHALGSTIARLAMDKEKMEKVERLMSAWDDWYPGMGNMQHSALWADHLKCRDPQKWCGLSRFDYVQVFNPWHGWKQIHIPNQDDPDTDLKGTVNQWLPWETANALFAMEEMYEHLTFDEQEPGDLKKLQGTMLSVNLQLYLMSHFYTDVHMPLHAMETFAYPLYGGDWGGNQWQMDGNCTPEAEELGIWNMHSWWDSMAALGGDTWPTITIEHLDNWAEELMKEYPRDHAKIAPRLEGTLNGLNMKAIVEESYKVGQEEVFRDFDFTNLKECPYPVNTGRVVTPEEVAAIEAERGEARGAADECGYYCMSQAYIESSTEVMKVQVVLQGYRYANFLDYVAPHLPDPDDVRPPSDGAGAFATGATAALVACLVGRML